MSEEILFHYTSVDAYLAICDSHKLRTSDLLALNDPREVSLGAQILQEFLDGLGYPATGPKQEHLDALRANYHSIKSDFSLFGISFTRNRDSLPQWLEYGDRGRGICIGFREDPFSAKVHGFLRRSDVAYSAEEFRARIEETFLKSEAGWEKANGQFDDDEKREFLFSSSLDLLAQCASYKHHSWAHEREVRFTFFCYKFGEGKDTYYGLSDALEDGIESKVSFRNSGGTIVPFVDIPLGDYVTIREDSESGEVLFVVDEVIVGPSCPSTLDTVGAAMNTTGKSIHCPKLVRSDCNLRL